MTDRQSYRRLQPDLRYGSILVSQFINALMVGGKRAVAQRVFYHAMDQIKKRVRHKQAMDVFTDAVQYTKPLIEVRARRVGGVTYQVPVQVKAGRQQALAIRWIIGAARDKKGRAMHQRLADELIAASRRYQ
jgi:small subunit ribosomal protein S7